jgi:L-2-hydroxyglutarate oxidase LhgO
MPRRGQFLILSALPSASGLLTRPIQPVPTQRTKGIFVFPSLYGQIIVGPTAADQESRFDREPDDRVRDELLDVARRVVPSLLSGDPADGSSSSAAIIGEYVGIRPATDLRDYQIRLMARRRWVTCAGIRSTGTLRRPSGAPLATSRISMLSSCFALLLLIQHSPLFRINRESSNWTARGVPAGAGRPSSKYRRTDDVYHAPSSRRGTYF